MAHRIIENKDELIDFTRFLGNLKLPLTVEWTQGRDRSKDQNALQFLWASEAAQQLGDRTSDEVRRTWKLRYGIPILCEASAEFRAFCNLALRHLSYEDRVKAMEYVPVTSEMTVRQMVQYLDTVQRECLEQGLRLTDPDPALAKHQARYRQPKSSSEGE